MEWKGNRYKLVYSLNTNISAVVKNYQSESSQAALEIFGFHFTLMWHLMMFFPPSLSINILNMYNIIIKVIHTYIIYIEKQSHISSLKIHWRTIPLKNNYLVIQIEKKFGLVDRMNKTLRHSYVHICICVCVFRERGDREKLYNAIQIKIWDMLIMQYLFLISQGLISHTSMFIGHYFNWIIIENKIQ
jgi:hypothetical protein